MVMVMSINLKDIKLEKLEVEKDKITYPKELRLILRLRYQRAILIRGNENIYTLSQEEIEERTTGFYVLSSEDSYIKLKKEHSNEEIRIKAQVKDVWHRGTNGIIELVAKFKPEEICEIDEKLCEHDVEVGWDINALCFPTEEKMKKFGIICPIWLHEYSHYQFKVSRKDFVENIVKPVDGLQRKFIEMPLPTEDFLDKVPPDLKPIAKALKEKLEFLIEALKELTEAKTTKDYRNVLTHTRLAEDQLSGKIGSIMNDLISKLYLELGTFEGEAGEDQAKRFVGSLRSILGSLEDMCGNIAMHSTRKGDRKTYKAYPERIDAQYILYASILTVDYIIKRLRKYVIERS